MKIIKEKKYSWDDVPSTLKNRFYKTVGLGLLVILFAILVACVLAASAQVIFIFLGLAVAAFLIAYKFYYDLTRSGYTEIKGTVSFVKEIVSFSAKGIKRGGKRVLYYHIETDDGTVIFLPADKTIEELPLNSRIKLYTAFKYSSVEINGLTRISPVWGYILLAKNISS